MGYTHYYYTAPTFDKDSFQQVAADFKKMVMPLKHLGVVLADGNGKDCPTISPTEICFNGKRDCGHEERELGITWPSRSASGIVKNGVDTILLDITKSRWFGGASLEARACGGDCSHEALLLEQKHEPHVSGDYTEEPEGEYRRWTDASGRRRRTPDNIVGKYFECTKTAYKPYDLAVNVCLVIAKHHLKDGITVGSDGTIENWQEGMQLCQHFLGYGTDFALDC